MPITPFNSELVELGNNLTTVLCFHNYRIMERDTEARGGLALTDAVLEELKEQAPEGCLLCALSALDEEDWD
jgi:hypothetical protein